MIQENLMMKTTVDFEEIIQNAIQAEEPISLRVDDKEVAKETARQIVATWHSMDLSVERGSRFLIYVPEAHWQEANHRIEVFGNHYGNTAENPIAFQIWIIY